MKTRFHALFHIDKRVMQNTLNTKIEVLKWELIVRDSRRIVRL